MAKLTVLSYNLLFNKALRNIDKVIESTKPDVICLQEFETLDENFRHVESHGYRLADASNSFIKFGRVFGQATFYNKKTVQFVSSTTLNLPRSYYEIVLLILRGVNEPRTVLKTIFKKRGFKGIFAVYNLHLSSYQATNRTRARQIEKTLADLKPNGAHHAVVAGDFNYPYGRKKFESLIAKYDLEEATNSLYFTSVFRLLGLIPFKFKVDYILFRGVKHIKTERISSTFSDHFPIFSQFKL